MIYITQLIFVKDGQESVFLEFESMAIPLLETYNGKVLYRVRPDKENFIDAEGELPYEIHLVSFESEQDFKAFAQDKKRDAFMHLKKASVRATLTTKGHKM